MALSLDTIRNSILTSLFGRRIGLDPNSYLAGPLGMLKVIDDLSSASTGTAVRNNGVVNITGTSLLTSANAFALANPRPSVPVIIANVNANSSAGSPGSTAMTIVRNSTAFYIASSEGSTETTINLTPGSAVTLMGLSTSLYQVVSRTSLAGVIINGTT